MHIDEEVKRSTARWGSTSPTHDPRSNLWYWAAVGAMSAIATVALVYGTLSFSRPDVISQLTDNLPGTLSIAVGFAGIGYLLAAISGKMASATFEKRKDARLSHHYLFQKIDKSKSELLDAFIEENKEDKPEDKISAPGSTYSYGAASQESHFERYISDILRSLSAYASSSEQTAEKLLDKGVLFMTFGLGFYVFAIILWQVFANLTSPDPHVMYIGMAACSMTFVIIEFLAAWFFKQYRYYVEVSLSCLRVRSVYDRYLLGYYALKAFKEDSEVSARDKMMDVLKEDVNWPTYKGSSANDFNYMMESMGAAHTSLEKIRKIFKDSGKGKAQ